MSSAVGPRRRTSEVVWSPPHAALDRRFEAVVFDWDGTAVPDREADASVLRELVEELCALGLDLAVITGTHVGTSTVSCVPVRTDRAASISS